VKDLDLTTPRAPRRCANGSRRCSRRCRIRITRSTWPGLSIDQLLQALLDLKHGADTVAGGILSAAQQMAAAADALKTDFEVYGTDPVGQVEQLAKLYAGVGGIGTALAGLDLSSVTGRGAAITALQQLYGGDKGNKAQTDAILELLRALRAAPEQGAPGATDPNTQTSGAERITIEQADRLISLTESLLVFARQTAQNTSALEALLRPATYAPVQAPALPSAFLAAGASGPMQLTVKHHDRQSLPRTHRRRCASPRDPVRRAARARRESGARRLRSATALQQWDQVRGSPSRGRGSDAAGHAASTASSSGPWASRSGKRAGSGTRQRRRARARRSRGAPGSSCPRRKP
jgi:hypothetical protein